MPDSITSPAALVADRILASNSGRMMDCLPPELVPEILVHLDEADLRNAAAVSRLFYASASRAGLLLHLDIGFSGPDDVAALEEIVTRVQRNGLRLSVRAGFGDRKATNAQEFLRILSLTCPFLVSLLVAAPSPFFPFVVAALRHPAPNLTDLKLRAIHTVDDPAVDWAVVDLFVGTAPKLHQLSLDDVPLGRHPVPAFSSVHSLSLFYDWVFPDFELALHFPCVRCLDLTFYTDEEPSPPRSLRLDGVNLRKLTLDECDSDSLRASILRLTSLEGIPDVVITHRGNGGWTEPIWYRKDGGPLCIRLRGDVDIIVVPEHRRWRCTYSEGQQDVSDPLYVLSLPGLCLPERLAYLRMHNGHIVSFLEWSCPALGALRELRLDFDTEYDSLPTLVWPPDWLVGVRCRPISFTAQDVSAPSFSTPSYNYVHCSALQRLTFFAMNEVLAVNTQEVAFLGRALGQCARPKEERALLVLIGVELTMSEHPLLDETFSAVCQHDFAGGDSTAGRDAGLWDEDFK